MPRSTGDVRFGYDVTVRMLPWPKQSAPLFLLHAHATEVTAVHVRNPVVAREPLVHEGVVGIQQVEDAAVLAHDALEEELRLGAEAVSKLVVEVREVARIRDVALQVPQHQPLAREVVDERARPRIGEHAAHLLLEHRRPAQPALCGCIEQLIVGDRAPEEERQPRGELEVVTSSPQGRPVIGPAAVRRLDPPHRETFRCGR